MTFAFSLLNLKRLWQSGSLLAQESQAPLEGKAGEGGVTKEAGLDSVRKLINVS